MAAFQNLCNSGIHKVAPLCKSSLHVHFPVLFVRAHPLLYTWFQFSVHLFFERSFVHLFFERIQRFWQDSRMPLPRSQSSQTQSSVLSWVTTQSQSQMQAQREPAAVARQAKKREADRQYDQQKHTRSFQTAWQEAQSWLMHDIDNGVMFCSISRWTTGIKNLFRALIAVMERHGKVLEYENFPKSHGKVMEWLVLMTMAAF